MISISSHNVARHYTAQAKGSAHPATQRHTISTCTYGINCTLDTVPVAIFGTVISLYSDFKAIEEDKIKLIYTLGGKKRDVLFKVVLPGNIPSIISQMKVNIGLSLVGVIIGEFLAAKAGLGYLIIYGSQVFKLDWVIMSIVILCIVATGLYKLLTHFEKRVTR